MKQIELDAAAWLGPDAVWAAVLGALGAPSWHGRNLDALNDSVGGGDVNAVNAPFRIETSSLDRAAPAARVTAWRICLLFQDLRRDGVDVWWVPEVNDTIATAILAYESFHLSAREKARLIAAGDASLDRELHAAMGTSLRALFSAGPAGRDCIEALLGVDEPEVASWIATELAARGEQRGVDVLERLTQSSGMAAFNARVALKELPSGRLGSPFPDSSA